MKVLYLVTFVVSQHMWGKESHGNLIIKSAGDIGLEGIVQIKETIAKRARLTADHVTILNIISLGVTNESDDESSPEGSGNNLPGSSDGQLRDSDSVGV